MGKLIGLGALVLVLVFGVVCVGSFISAYSFNNDMKSSLDAKLSDNKQVLANYGKKIQEMVQVPGMYKDDLKEVVTSALQGRYGADGSKAVFQWIKEHDVNLDSELYRKIQQTIEGGRNKFENAQTEMIDLKRVYQRAEGSLWLGFWIGVAGNGPNLKDYVIVTSGRAEEAYETGVEEAIQLR